MNFRFKLFLLFIIFIHAFLFSNDEIVWKEIEEGCFYSRATIQKDNEKIDFINIIKVNPDKFYFRVYYKEKEKGWPEMYDIKEWHEKYHDAKIFINGSYYDENRRPTTAIWQEGKCINRKKGLLKKGALIFCAYKDGKYKIDMIDLNKQPVDIEKENFFYAIQSMPVIVSNERITVQKSNWKANRSVIAKDRNGNILLIVSEGSENYKSFTLYDLAGWLLKKNLNIELAVNLDGGYESQLSIKTEGLQYTTIGRWETNDTGDISKQGLKIKIPVVLGFFNNNFR